MKTQKLIFNISSKVILLGWIILFAFPNWAMGDKVILYGVFIVISAAYIYYLTQGIKNPVESEYGKPGFFKMRNVLAIFDNPNSSLACWMHIIVFDLIVGLYIRTQGALLDIEHWKLIPCYFMTLMFGPIGLLLFILLTLFH